ncbi:MAG: sigma-E factor negative regulatory protein [Steroidobacteraceae bacterium]|jgi:sigma-E factor negative regulatory protein RseA
MSEQIREQVSAFLDGELPSSETELLLKRLTRDAELRESFGRYALIGEACRGAKHAHLTRGLCERVNRAINGEAEIAVAASLQQPALRWWRPMAGASVAASVAVLAVFALQQRANTPTPGALTANNLVTSSAPARIAAAPLVPKSKEPVSYTTPAALPEAPAAFPAARLTNYVFAHSKYQSLLGQRDVLTDLIVEPDEQMPAAAEKTQ